MLSVILEKACSRMWPRFSGSVPTVVKRRPRDATHRGVTAKRKAAIRQTIISTRRRSEAAILECDFVIETGDGLCQHPHIRKERECVGHPISGILRILGSPAGLA